MSDEKPAEKTEKPTAPAPNPAAELKALQGQWKVVRIEKGKDADSYWAGIFRQKVTLDAIDRLNIIELKSGVERNCLNFLSIENAFNCGLVYSTDSGTTIKTIDLSYFGSHSDNGSSGTVACGIYEIIDHII